MLTSFASTLIDFGLGDAIVQRSRIKPSLISSLFWFSTAIGVTVAAVVAACSPLIATIFREPRLGPIALCEAVVAGLPFGPTGIAVATVIAALLIAVPSVKYAGGPIGSARLMSCAPQALS